MRLWSGLSPEFARQTVQNEIADRLAEAFFAYFRRQPGDAEYRSWGNSLRAMKDVVEHAGLFDHGVLLEYQLPFSSKRIDCMLLGKDDRARSAGVIVELKQWDTCEPSDLDSTVVTWLAGAKRDALHPSVQSMDYRRFLADNLVVFHGEDPVTLDSCAYLHNYAVTSDDPLLDPKFSTAVSISPVFGKRDVEQLKEFLVQRMSAGHGAEVLERVESSPSRPSSKLMEHVAAVIDNEPRYVLLDEQRVAFDRVMAAARSALKRQEESTILIRGGPGTGKSVIAINLMAALLERGVGAHYATGSKAFTETLRKVIGKRGSELFTYFNAYGKEGQDQLDVLICDEAHRIRETSNDRFTAKAKRSNKLQIDELLDSSRVTVFLIDDRQGVRPNEIGSTELIRERSKHRGRKVYEHELDIQFRCAGSDAFIEWVGNTLDVERTSTVIWNQQEEFDLRIVDSPAELDQLIRRRANDGFSARLVAGFCWPWSKQPDVDGSLIEDVQVGSFVRPWNAHYEARGLRKDIPKASLWAYDPRGIDQIGCVYTAQGFEFDYVGLIFGKDLRYDFGVGGWVADKRESRDSVVNRSKDQFMDLVRNTYRVLMTRGLKGCYVYFVDKETEQFVRSRLEGAQRADDPVATVGAAPTTVAVAEPFRRLQSHEVRPFENSVPVYDLAFAAGRFTAQRPVAEAQGEELRNPEDFDWVELPALYRPQPGLFVARVTGDSMNRRIPDGAWCLFRLGAAGSRKGKVVVFGLRDDIDPETGASFTVKFYDSEQAADDGSWKHTRVRLIPDSTNPAHQVMELDESQEGAAWVVAEFVSVL